MCCQRNDEGEGSQSVTSVGKDQLGNAMNVGTRWRRTLLVCFDPFSLIDSSTLRSEDGKVMGAQSGGLKVSTVGETWAAREESL